MKPNDARVFFFEELRLLMPSWHISARLANSQNRPSPRSAAYHQWNTPKIKTINHESEGYTLPCGSALNVAGKSADFGGNLQKT